jgi:hypothetical protein
VHWISLEELSQQPNLDPLLNLLTLPVRPESELAASSQQILASRPDLDTVVLPMLVQRFPQLTEEQIMVIAGIPREEIRHTRAVQDWLGRGPPGGPPGRRSSRHDPPPPQPPLRPLERSHHRPDPGAAAGAVGSPGRRPARLPGPGRPGRLAGRQLVATSEALSWNGLEPVFADIDPHTFCLDPASIEASITPRTTAILPVHCYGFPCDVEAIQRIADDYNLKVIYDAAHAFGVECHCGSLLQHGDLSVLSFHATKVFNTFEGGAIICPDAKRRNGSTGSRTSASWMSSRWRPTASTPR